MISKAILDTDTLSEIIKTKDPIVLGNAADYLDEHGQLSFTSATVHEVLFGLHCKSATRQIAAFFELMAEHEEIVPTKQDYHLAARIRADLQRAGTPIGSFDPLIAACAVERGLPLVTGNTRHHGFIQNAGYALQLINWRETV